MSEAENTQFVLVGCTNQGIKQEPLTEMEMRRLLSVALGDLNGKHRKFGLNATEQELARKLRHFRDQFQGL